MIDTAGLGAWIARQRWFGAKERPLLRVDLVDVGVLDDGPPALVLALASVTFEAGERQLYHLPLLVDEHGDPADVSTSPERLVLLGELMAHAVTIKGDSGLFDFEGPGLNPLEPPGSQSVTPLAGEQSHTSVVLDERVIVKLFRRLEEGPNPELEITRLLTAQGFPYTPSHVGEIVYRSNPDDVDDRSDTIALGVAQTYVTDAWDGWQETLREVRALYGAIHREDAAEDRRTLTELRASSMLMALAELGEVTASLHLALASSEGGADFVPAAIEPSDLNLWADSASASLERELARDVELAPLAGAIETHIDGLRSVEDAGSKSRVHGDYHLGQVLVGSRGWTILDFEGEPARPLEQRRARQSPLRDVAGMLRSFSYAASAALFEEAEPGTREWERLEPWADTWEDLARERFLNGYLRKSHEGRLLPAERDSLFTMLGVFEIDKALYELSYERGHRPDWVRIPRRGIARALDRASAQR